MHSIWWWYPCTVFGGDIQIGSFSKHIPIVPTTASWFGTITSSTGCHDMLAFPFKTSSGSWSEQLSTAATSLLMFGSIVKLSTICPKPGCSPFSMLGFGRDGAMAIRLPDDWAFLLHCHWLLSSQRFLEDSSLRPICKFWVNAHFKPGILDNNIEWLHIYSIQTVQWTSVICTKLWDWTRLHTSGFCFVWRLGWLQTCFRWHSHRATEKSSGYIFASVKVRTFRRLGWLYCQKQMTLVQRPDE